jgi:hypothetical protein
MNTKDDPSTEASTNPDAIIQLEYRLHGELIAVAIPSVSVDAPEATIVSQRAEADTHGSPVGKRYRGWDGNVYLVESWDKRTGFWLRDVNSGARKDISERAIDRTYHRVRD